MTALTKFLAALFMIVATGAAWAGDVRQNLGPDGLALKGYDPVAYQTQNAAVPGSTDITAEHDGATYRFASAENRAAFMAAPAQYAPAFGGYCAMGVVFGRKIDIDPASFRIVDGALYLNVNPDVQARWQQDIPGNLTKANTKWPEIADKAAGDLK